MAILDIDRLLAPISGDNPCGESLRWDPLYDELKQARREDDRDAFGGATTQANWPFVRSRAEEALYTRSKDLMLAGYLTESLVQLHGFAGLRDGLRLINGLLENFWDSLYPQIDEDDLEPRAAPIVWLTEPDRGARLPNRLREIPMTPASGDTPGYSWSYWKSRYAAAKGDNEDVDAYTRRRNEAEERGQLFEAAVAATPLPFYEALREDITACSSELARFQRTIDERFGSAAPGTTSLRQTLDECAALVARICKEKGGGESSSGEAPAAALSAESSSGSLRKGPIGSRGEALARLSEIATFFRETEPHSPISYLVERASSWGRMSLEELLGEIVKDDSTRAQIGELLGIKRND